MKNKIDKLKALLREKDAERADIIKEIEVELKNELFNAAKKKGLNVGDIVEYSDYLFANSIEKMYYKGVKFFTDYSSSIARTPYLDLRKVKKDGSMSKTSSGKFVSIRDLKKVRKG